jgi:glycogen debranching enzyme
LSVALTNPHLDCVDGSHLLHGTIHFHRKKFLWENTCQEEILVRNFGLVPTCIELMLEFDVDFADIFEVRGYPRAKRRALLEPRVGDSFVTLSYQGLDEVLRKTTIASGLRPTVVTTSEMRFRLDLESREEKAFSITVSCCWDDERPLSSYHQATKALAREVPKSQGCEIETSNEQFNDWINRSRADLQMMITATPKGLYPYAGVPWFSTVFGRDGYYYRLRVSMGRFGSGEGCSAVSGRDAGN